MSEVRLLCTQPLDPALKSLPPRGAEDYLTAVENLLSSAIRSVQIVCPFVDAKGAEVLERAWRRSRSRATWEVYTRHSPDELVDAARRSNWLLYEYVGTRGGDERRGFHCKLFIADARRAILGSVNLIYENLVENLELGVLIDDPTDVRALLSVPRALRRASRKRTEGA